METAQRPVFGTLGLYEELADRLNADPRWREIGRPITYSMVYEYLPPIGKSFLLDFREGEIVDVAELATPDERGAVDFVITAEPSVFAALMRKELQPTVAMATGKAKVKGKQAVLLRHMKRFSYLLNTLCDMDPVFP